MVNLYLTGDRIGAPTGGGAVTYHEYKALTAIGAETHPIDGVRVAAGKTPFEADETFASMLASIKEVDLAAIYAGCFTKTVLALKTNGAKISYTAAAHDIQESRKEFESLGIPFSFPHLMKPELWAQYVQGYLDADLVICPSRMSRKCMESYGCKNVVVIPHGCEVPETISPAPRNFTVGYLGQAGPDKGLRYLFEAWKKLAYKDATLLIAGNNIDAALPLWRHFGGGNIHFMGFVKNVSEFYSQISLYVQPSVTEGFGIEILEAMAHGRPVVASYGAGAVDVLENGGHSVEPRNVDSIAEYIDMYRKNPDMAHVDGAAGRKKAKTCTWNSVREEYQAAWRKLLV